jgi:mRNA-degrading endonuclease RelE of RelBE toxin-antitoxin system
MNIFRTEIFKRDFRRMPEAIQRRVEKALRLLVENLRHPSLRAKKMEGERDPEGRDIWEARASRGYRFTFAIAGDTYILYRLGPHDIERRPR